MDKENLLKRLASLIFLIFLLNYLAEKFYWYSAIWWFDMLMHFLGGFWLGLLFFYIFPPKDNLIRSAIGALLFVLFIGLGWELFEVALNNMIAGETFDYVDTISDLFFDLSGGLCAILFIWKKSPK